MTPMEKILSKKAENWEEAEQWIRAMQLQNQKIVFTNGCFDLLHMGHIQYLAEAKLLGDQLIIGLNSDLSVQKLKGPKRPIHTEKERMNMLCALEMVDKVVLFDQETPFELISFLKPDILVKGGDYTVDQIVGADIVLENSGKVASLSFLKGYSSTNTIQKIKSI